ncbi:hypothetical protein B7494_g1131 [Chlorociboria aeruginascens]|nr:hypothetical protein B7494_g1131 [Chlorociboria aeruginascens]
MASGGHGGLYRSEGQNKGPWERPRAPSKSDIQVRKAESQKAQRRYQFHMTPGSGDHAKSKPGGPTVLSTNPLVWEGTANGITGGGSGDGRPGVGLDYRCARDFHPDATAETIRDGQIARPTARRGVVIKTNEMCIVLATTAHPSYALIILDNRDEFITRPTSRPDWWLTPNQEILSARDLQREEHGTWLGITRTGNFAVLTNYREEDSHDAAHPIQGSRSRGGMVTAWLTNPEDESTEHFVHRLLKGEGVKGVGGFSLVCGKLRKQRDSDRALEPLAIISNRSGNLDDVQWIGGRRGEVYGLSNTCYADPLEWPKVKMGKEKLLEAVEGAVEAGWGEEELVDKLYAVLDSDTLPEQNGQGFEEFLYQLRKSIFIPAIGRAEDTKADQIAAARPTADGTGSMAKVAAVELEQEAPDVESNNDMTGVYGTQRQTIILVDWDGHVTFRERSLWDSKGKPITRGEADVKFEFKIQGWDGEKKLLRSAGDGDEMAKSQIISILTTLQAQSDASARIPKPPSPPPRRYPEPWPGAPKLLETRPRPLEKLAGRRRVPSLASLSGSHSTFLRLGKPHNPYLSRVLRDYQEQQQKRFNASDSILFDVELARNEEKWEYITSRELRYEGKSLKEWEAKQPGLDWGKNNWTKDLLDVKSDIMDRVYSQQKKQKQRAMQMIDLVQKEKELMLKERATRKHEKNLARKQRKLDESRQTS